MKVDEEEKVMVGGSTIRRMYAHAYHTAFNIVFYLGRNRFVIVHAGFVPGKQSRKISLREKTMVTIRSRKMVP
jgi:hypothetical protein